MPPKAKSEPQKVFVMEFSEGDNLETKVFGAIGAASMTWGQPPKGRVFNSEMAKQIGDALMTEIMKDKAGSKSVADRVQDLVIHYEGRISNQVDIINRLLAEQAEMQTRAQKAEDRVAELEAQLTESDNSR